MHNTIRSPQYNATNIQNDLKQAVGRRNVGGLHHTEEQVDPPVTADVSDYVNVNA